MLSTTRIIARKQKHQFSIPWLFSAAILLYALELPPHVVYRKHAWLCQGFTISSTGKTASSRYRHIFAATSRQPSSSSNGIEDGESKAVPDNSSDTHIDNGTPEDHTFEERGDTSTSSRTTKPEEKSERQNSNSKMTTEAPTLYDILGASPSDTKAEIKRRYVALAKISHPDAIRGKEHAIRGKEQADSNVPDFSEIARAWQILSDKKERRRYDRKMRAEAFSKDISEFASKLSEEAAPQVRDLLDSFAVPFIRRTTATTLASVQAVANDLTRQRNGASSTQASNRNVTTADSRSQDLSGVFTSAMNAAQKAGRLVDNMELIEKSEDLERGVISQIEEANKVKAELDEVTVARFRVALRTPNSTFTSLDAFRLLAYWNISTSRSLLERVLLKNPINKQVQDLEGLELALTDKVGKYKVAQSNYKNKERSLQNARAEKVLAVQAEKRASEALALARHRLEETTAQVRNATKELSQSGSVLEKVADESERLMNGVTRQREVVRSSMQKKEDIIARENVNSAGFIMDDEQLKLCDLRDLEEREMTLNEEYSRLEDLANSLQSRANELKERAEQLKREQQ